MTISQKPPQDGVIPFGPEQIKSFIKNRIAQHWDNSNVSQKIDSGEELTLAEIEDFIKQEAGNIHRVEAALHGIIVELKLLQPDFLQLLLKGHDASETKITKFLIALDDRERFYVDMFVFGPRAYTYKHGHNAHCVSYQLEGITRETSYEEVESNREVVDFIQRRKGDSTIVTPHGDGIDVHVISNDDYAPSVTLHVYSQHVLGANNKVTVNRSNAPLGPTSVPKYLSGEAGYGLAVRVPVTKVANYFQSLTTKNQPTNNNKKEKPMTNYVNKDGLPDAILLPDDKPLNFASRATPLHARYDTFVERYQAQRIQDQRELISL